MIFFFDANGNLIKSVPTNVYQGSNKASRIWLLMPTAPTNVVNVAFTLPNGQYSPQRLMTNATLGEGVTDGLQAYIDETGQVINAWYYDLKKDVTTIAGEMSAQFFVATADEETIATQSVKIEVLPGTPSVNLPPSTSEYEELMNWLASFNTNVLNRVTQNESDIAEIERQIETIKGASFVIVQTLPTASADTLGNIYLVPKENSATSNVYDEYITVENDGVYSWEKIGSTEFNANYNDLNNVPIINADLSSISPIENTYYRHTGENTETYNQGLIYLYVNSAFTAINGKGGTTVTVNGEAVETFNADTKLDKVEKGSKILVYTNDDNSNTTTTHYLGNNSANYAPYNIPMIYGSTAGGSAHGTGYLLTNVPIKDYQCANKKFVEDTVANAGGGKLYIHNIYLIGMAYDNGFTSLNNRIESGFTIYSRRSTAYTIADLMTAFTNNVFFARSALSGGNLENGSIQLNVGGGTLPLTNPCQIVMGATSYLMDNPTLSEYIPKEV